MSDTTLANRSERLADQLDVVAYEALLFATKALRGGVDLSDPGARAMAKIATSSISSWSRNRQTDNANRAVGAAMAYRLASDTDGRFAAALRVTMPDDAVSITLALPAEVGASGG